MAKKTTANVNQPAIRPGDIWKDKHGNKITVRSVVSKSIHYDREGYGSVCACSPQKFIHDFVKVTESKESLSGWLKENDLLTRIDKFRKVIAGKRKAK